MSERQNRNAKPDDAHQPNDGSFKDDREIAKWNARLAETLRDKRRRLAVARELEPGMISYGAANFPHDPNVWVADWRDSLPNGDPRRRDGPPIVRNGSPAAYHSMRAASDAIKNAYGLPPEAASDLTNDELHSREPEPG